MYRITIDESSDTFRSSITFSFLDFEKYSKVGKIADLFILAVLRSNIQYFISRESSLCLLQSRNRGKIQIWTSLAFQYLAVKRVLNQIYPCNLS